MTNATKLNQLRNSVKDVNKDACTFNQAVKSLTGLEKKHAAVCEALGIETFGFKSICGAWADALRISIDGKPVMGLYMSEAAKVTVTDAKGEPKEVNAYERIVNKKGVVSFRSVKLRVLQQPKAWSHEVILEGLCQSAELVEAKAEAAAAQAHFDDLSDNGEVYVKVTEKGADGSMTVTFEKVEVEA